MSLQILQHSKKTGDRIYRYYSIAEAYWEEGKSKKRVLAHLGSLEPEQVQKLRQVLQIQSKSSLQIVDPSSLNCSASWNFLDVSIFHQLWMNLGVGQVIEVGKGDYDLGKLLEILVLNRITSPRSKLGVTRWYGTTALEQILEIPNNAISESRMYRSLPSIEEHHVKIEEFIFNNIIQNKVVSQRLPLFFYDLTSSYFEGEEVNIAAFSAHSKDHRPDRLQVVLGLLIDERGVPFSWDIFKGNQGDAPTLIKQIQKLETRFSVKRALLVFDRGFLSNENLKSIEDAGYEYLTGLDAPQIETVIPSEIREWLLKISIDTVEKCIEVEKSKLGWKSLTDTTFYLDLGNINHRKTLLLFDTSRYRSSVFKRQKKIDNFKKWLHRQNEKLRSYKKDAKKAGVEQEVSSEIDKKGLKNYVNFELHEYVTENHTFRRSRNSIHPGQGHYVKVRSFQIILTEKNQNILDGVFALITSTKSTLTSPEMALAYREKYLIEMAFREMKSILKLRPWFVYKEEHVRAHYTVCVLSYLIERLLDIALEQQDLKSEGWTLPRFKEEIEKYRLVEIEFPGTAPGKTGQRRKVLQSLPCEIKQMLKKLGLNSALKLPTAHS